MQSTATSVYTSHGRGLWEKLILGVHMGALNSWGKEKRVWGPESRKCGLRGLRATAIAFRQGFFGLVTLCSGGSPSALPMFSSILRLGFQGARRALAAGWDNAKCLQALSNVPPAKSLPAENHCLTITHECIFLCQNLQRKK